MYPAYIHILLLLLRILTSIHKPSFQDNIKLNPSTDFYKKLALDCAADQVSVDIFQLSSQYADCSSLSKYSSVRNYQR